MRCSSVPTESGARVSGKMLHSRVALVLRLFGSSKEYAWWIGDRHRAGPGTGPERLTAAR